MSKNEVIFKPFAFEDCRGVKKKGLYRGGSFDDNMVPRDALTDLGGIALLVLDIQNDFCHDGGVFARSGLDVKPAQEAAMRIKEFIDKIRRYDITVVYTKQIESDEISPENLKRQFASGKLVPVCAPGSWGSELYQLKPRKGEYVVEKHTYDAFSNPVLRKYLKRIGTQTVIITGVNTDVCIDTTVRRVFTEGFNIVVPHDLVATVTGADGNAQDHFLKIFQRFYGRVTDSAAILEYLQKTQQSRHL